MNDLGFGKVRRETRRNGDSLTGRGQCRIATPTCHNGIDSTAQNHNSVDVFDCRGSWEPFFKGQDYPIRCRRQATNCQSGDPEPGQTQTGFPALA